ncbi:MAG: AMP-binding protein [Chloroflexi bacterium]|nr:AMP-binding protein [Chloroflexota bacterium]MDA8187762.1 AMP-binding protein [Dehalococcoidales bacterium]
MIIDETFKAAVRKYPNKPVLIFLGEKYTYAHLDDVVEKLSRALHKHGVRPKDKAIIFLPHCPQWIVVWLALQRMGAVAVPVTHFYGPKDLQYIANDSGAETIFCMDTNFGYVSKVLAETSLKRVVVTSIADALPWWKKTVGKLYNRIPEGKFSLGENVYAFPSLLKESAPALPPVHAAPEDMAEMLYTGGTTGFPKGVPISSVLLLESVLEQRRSSSKLIPPGTDVVIQGAPLYHILGQAVGFGALFTGDTLILLPKMNLDAIFEHIQRYKAKSFFGTPTLYRMILEHDRLDQYNLRSLEYNFSGGDALPGEVANRWLKKFGKPISQGYGATETCGGVALTPPGEQSPEGTGGKILSIRRALLVDPDTLEPVAEGGSGELLVSSDHMVTAYWNKPEETARHFVDIDGQRWYRTGDIVRIDKEGWLYFMDRSVDIIKHKGYRVAASKIEAVLQEHPAVIAACAVGIADPAVGERIKAFVVLKEDVKGVTAYDLATWCRQRLASYEVPQYIEFRDMLPKSKVGKLLRRELRAEERRKFAPV